MREGATFKSLADLFKERGALPSAFVDRVVAEERAEEVYERLKNTTHRFGVRLHQTGDYPSSLRDARNPVELVYYQGYWDLINKPSLAVVGSRRASEKGIELTRFLAREVVERGYVVVSGLAKGIDTAAHSAAIEEGGETIGVIGTPLGEYYPSENRELQDRIAREFLLISQVPVLRYAKQNIPTKRYYFPERNATMSAITSGTIIVEADETSGTLTQARAALFQNRKLFIMDRCFRANLSWPEKFVEKGAIRIYNDKVEDIWDALKS